MDLLRLVVKVALFGSVLAHEFSGTRYDCGSKIGYLKANIAFALKHPEVASELRKYMKVVASKLGS